jgi:hypothetical protein
MAGPRRCTHHQRQSGRLLCASVSVSRADSAEPS